MESYNTFSDESFSDVSQTPADECQPVGRNKISLPAAFVERMRGEFESGAEFERFLDCYSAAPLRAMRVNTLKLSKERFLELCPWRTEQSELLDEGLILAAPAEHIGTHPYHIAGLFYMQEPSAMSVIDAAEIEPGMRVLDLCAAPGGKSGGIAARLRGKGLLVSNEIVPNRAKQLARNLERLGIVNAVVTSAHPEAAADALPQYFDRVVVDAPCSGEGMFRKDVTAIAEWSPAHVSACAARQMQILESAYRCVAPGGKLIYSTCTFSREENEGVIEAFCSAHPEFTVEMQRRLYPHTCRGEGHFAARLKRSGDGSIAEAFCVADEPKRGKSQNRRTGARSPRSSGVSGSAPLLPVKGKAELAALKDFLRETVNGLEDESALNSLLCSVYRTPNDLLVYAPFSVPESLSALRILSCGTTVGEFVKGRFKPCHAFFTACHGLGFRNEIRLSADSDELRRFLSGNTVAAPESMRDFSAVSVDGYPIGFGKAVDGVLKNHFPKGLAVAALR